MLKPGKFPTTYHCCLALNNSYCSLSVSIRMLGDSGLSLHQKARGIWLFQKEKAELGEWLKSHRPLGSCSRTQYSPQCPAQHISWEFWTASSLCFSPGVLTIPRSPRLALMSLRPWRPQRHIDQTHHIKRTAALQTGSHWIQPRAHM